VKPPTPPNEQRRLAELRKFDVLDTPPEELFDDLVELAANICQAPIALITLVDESRQWFKAKVGLQLAETPRDIAFCAHAINQEDLFVIRDATKDSRFADNPLVLSEPNIRFYAGAPLITPEGHALGTLCVIDRVSRQLSVEHKRALHVLSRHVMMLLELRRRAIEASALRAERDETRNQLQRERLLLEAAEKSRQALQHALDENAQINQSLREADARLRLAARASKIGFWEWEIATSRVLAPAELKNLLGWEDHEVPQTLQDWEALIHPDDLDRVRAQRLARVEGRRLDAGQHEFRVRHKDGSYRWIEARSELIRSEDGKPRRMIGCHIDVTELALAKRLTATERQVLELIATGVPSATVLDALCQSFENQFAPGACSVLLLEPDGAHVRHAAAPSLPPRYIAAIDGSAIGPAAGSCGTAAYTGSQVIVSDISTDPRWADYRDVALRDGLRACWSTPIFSENGKVLGTFAIYYRDTRVPGTLELRLIERATYLASIALARERSERTLRESEEKLRLLVLYAPSAIAMFDRDMRYLAYSRRWLTDYGLGEQDLIGRSHYEVFPDLPDRWKEVHRRCLNGATEEHEEDPFPRPDGSVDWVRWAVHPWRNNSGEVGGLIIFSEVVTERVNAQTALRESEERYRRIVELSPDAVTIHQDGKWVFANTAAARILGVGQPSQLVGRSLLDFMHPEVHEQVKARWKLLYEDRQPVDVAELKMVRADGSIVYLETRAIPIMWKGRPAAQVVARDVTERKHANEALRNYAERLQGMSRRLLEVEETARRNINRELHDRIGQNLSSLSLTLKLLRPKLSRNSRETADARLDAAQRLIETTTAQVRNLMTELRPPALDDYGLFAALRTYAESLRATTGLSISVKGGDVEPRLSPLVEMAFFRIAQEALANVAKHARASSVELSVTSAPDNVTLAVADNGKGFDIARIGTKRASWGLSIMRERAEAVGAKLHIESARQRGTRIEVELPRDIS
jgi:PAS domain S-box-containing protein